MKVEVCAYSLLVPPLSDAILISSNQRMKMAGGLSGVIHRLAGPGLRDYCDKAAPLPVGAAFVTPGFDSPFQWIVHAHPGNNFTHSVPWSCLAQTLLAALEAAEALRIRSLCMSAFGTGSAQIPVMAAACITMRTLRAQTGIFRSLESIKFCITNPTVLDTYFGAARIENLITHISNLEG